MEKIQDIFLGIPSICAQWQEFLLSKGLRPPSNLDTIDKTVGIYDEANGDILGCGSIKDNVIQLVAVSDKDGQNSARFNAIITELSNRLAAAGRYHIFVFTKPEYSQSFQYLGFHELVQTEFAALLEKGKPNINDFLSNIPKPVGKQIASIVMNANPFTLGHRALVEAAAAENDQVVVFVVASDGSLFKPGERLELVRQGLSDLSTVSVSSGADYMVSFATFPSYFIKDQAEITAYQTALDAQLFKKWIIPPLGITSRYLGEEPFSEATEIYNQSLKRELSDIIEVKIIPRKKADQEIISATAVRQAIKENNMSKIKSFVPATTYEFIKKNLNEIQTR
ncbi:MAG: [citrate (pro-3S)-lyase] ligase [Streptococcaceae bacterium]|jgi:[citrate (pro-3S)-lyase] ligase|nr:[citrate (pro-3S)-lyase] ligase [Streptococcaceae bacterium]